MKLITLDTETYYNQHYSLSKMSTDAYVLDPRFQLIGYGIKIDDEPAEWVINSEDDFTATALLATVDWSDAAILCHNTAFDAFILTQRYGIKPKLWLDTLGMARMLFPWLKSHSLAAIAEHLKLGVKGGYVADAKGKRLQDFNSQELTQYGEYCINDIDLTHAAAKLMMPRVPAIEFALMDMTTRMFTEPQFVGDEALLRDLYTKEVARKQELLDACMANKSVLMSNEKLATALRELGVEPPVKISARTGKEAYAFAKTDKEFSALLEHDDADVQALVAARLGVKTTIAETRLLNMADTAKRGPLPVYLNFWGAKQTGRFSGGNKNNWQNLPTRGISAGIRRAVCAPPGHKVVVGDSTGIELRVTAVCAGQMDVIDAIKEGRNLYCDFASRLFGRVITKAEEKEYLLGKTAVLGLGFGAGWAKFIEMARIQAKITLNEYESRRIVDMYRSVNNRVVDLWRHCNDVILPAIHNGENLMAVDVNGWCITGNNGFGVCGAPGVVYNNLRKDSNSDWVYSSGREDKVKIFGSKCVENLAQHVARQVVMWQTARFNKRFRVALSVHDEIVCVVPDDQVEECKAYMRECLTTAPPWCSDQLPLNCSIEVGHNYGDAE